ncbi:MULTISPECIES: effector binding domain-containing protein [Bacillaceae]|uniref:Effector binding domain-containing protein n=1 Tax=Evansella alkalicola TaxID=745819 RepID=A0ABS6JZ91_9BACI|nr:MULTISPECIES: effector binding domain-containing protein [Bacillaceae]MBU9723547.1 effector binding domain-containing protein [Bacillus alkalicola]
MSFTTISQVSKDFNISTRTLRYYDQIGVLPSSKMEDYAYRVYDENAVRRLQQILFLRKLRIPLKQIEKLLNSQEVSDLVDVFRDKVLELDDEITALETIRAILQQLIERSKSLPEETLKFDLLTDEAMRSVAQSLPLSKTKVREEMKVEDLSKATDTVNQLRDKDIRLIHLPPVTVAASHYIGEEPEHHAGEQLVKFIKESGLLQLKPDARVFGFNHPNPTKGNETYGYETWVTIPDDLEVSAPLVKKQFQGGLYAAHMITLGNFHEWEWLHNWVLNNQKYKPNTLDDNGEYMGGALEEHINFLYYLSLDWPEHDDHQLDLLYPVKLRNMK